VYLPAAAEGGRKPSNDEMVLLYGSAKPPLDAGFVVKGCMIYTAPGNGPVSMRLEYLGSGAPPACTDPTACGGECGTFTNSCGMVDCGQCCVPNPNPCPSSQCGGSAPDGCGGFVDCHADCSSTSQCKCGGKCQNNACICNQNPCP
jgi:hypothetical protein